MSYDASETDPVQAVPLAYAVTPGRRRSWRVVALAVFGVGLVMALGVSILLPSLHRRQMPARVRCAWNLRTIAGYVQMYANEHGGAFPADFATLRLTQDVASERFICDDTQDTPAAGSTEQQVAANLTAGGHLSYVYAGKGLTLKSPANAVVAYEPLSNHRDGMNVLFADGHVQWLNAAQGRRLIAELAAGQNPPRSTQPVGGAGQ